MVLTKLKTDIRTELLACDRIESTRKGLVEISNFSFMKKDTPFETNKRRERMKVKTVIEDTHKREKNIFYCRVSDCS